MEISREERLSQKRIKEVKKRENKKKERKEEGEGGRKRRREERERGRGDKNILMCGWKERNGGGGRSRN
ncbi:hypothetical protein [Serratia marcescens]|uniref:hypothetical protein n=1 Tax=Serratia marcescens TaxID=615 RepID=UPI0011133C64|nr:hypothetical protein [Serratia marcescens]